MSENHPFQGYQSPPYWEYEPGGSFPTRGNSPYTTQPDLDLASEITQPGLHNPGVTNGRSAGWQKSALSAQSDRRWGRRRQRSASRLLISIFVLGSLIALLGGMAVAVGPYLIHRYPPRAQTIVGAKATPQRQGSTTPSPAGTPSPQPAALPAAWTASGRGPVDAAEASVIAQGFVERYSSIETANAAALQQTLTSAELFLTPAARRRFSFPQVSRQAALADGVPIIDPPQTKGGIFFAIVTVPYTVISLGGVMHQQMTVVLVPAPFGGASVPASMGWEVTAWQNGTTPPPLPAQP